MEKETVGGGGESGKEGSNGVHVGPITSRPREIHRPSSLTKAPPSIINFNVFFVPLPSFFPFIIII